MPPLAHYYRISWPLHGLLNTKDWASLCAFEMSEDPDLCNSICSVIYWKFMCLKCRDGISVYRYFGFNTDMSIPFKQIIMALIEISIICIGTGFGQISAPKDVLLGIGKS